MAISNYTSREEILPLISHFLLTNSLPETASALKKELNSQGVTEKKSRIANGQSLQDILSRYSQVSTLFNLKVPRNPTAKKDATSSEKTTLEKLTNQVETKTPESEIASDTVPSSITNNEVQDKDTNKKQTKKTNSTEKKASKNAKSNDTSDKTGETTAKKDKKAGQTSAQTDVNDNNLVPETSETGVSQPAQMSAAAANKKQKKTSAEAKNKQDIKKPVVKKVKEPVEDVPDRELSPRTFSTLNSIFERTAPTVMKELGIEMLSADNEKVTNVAVSTKNTSKEKLNESIIPFHASDAGSGSEDSEPDSDDEKAPTTNVKTVSKAKAKPAEKKNVKKEENLKKLTNEGKLENETSVPVVSSPVVSSTKPSPAVPSLPEFNLEASSSDESENDEQSKKKGEPVRLRKTAAKPTPNSINTKADETKSKATTNEQVDSEKSKKKSETQAEPRSHKGATDEEHEMTKPAEEITKPAEEITKPADEKKKKKKKKQTIEENTKQPEEVLESQEVRVALAPLDTESTQKEVMKEVQKEVMDVDTLEPKKKKKKKKKNADADKAEGEEAPNVEVTEPVTIVSKEESSQASEETSTTPKKKKKKKKIDFDTEEELASSQEMIITSTQLPVTESSKKKKKKKLFNADVSGLELDINSDHLLLSSQETADSLNSSQDSIDTSMTKKKKKKRKHLYQNGDVTLEDIIEEVKSSQETYSPSSNSLIIDPVKTKKRALLTDARTAWAGENVKYTKKKKLAQGE